MAVRFDTGRIIKYEDTDDGFLRTHFRFRKIGDLRYRQLDGSEQVEKVTADELYKRQSLRTASLKPITLNHPAGGMVTSQNARQLQRGMTGNTIIRDDPYAMIVGVVTDAEMIDAIKAGDIADVSSGYWSTPVRRDAAIFQTDVKYNHFAGCKKNWGRAGPDVGFLGFSTDSQDEMSDKDIAVQLIDSEELDPKRPIIWTPYKFDNVALQVDDATPTKKIVQMHGLEIGLQYEPGDTRHGRPLPVSYGHIRRHKGADGMSLDVYLGKNLESEKVFQVKQLTEMGEFDEEKMLLGFDSSKEAQDTYLAVMPQEMFGGIEEISLEDLRSYSKKDTKTTMTITELRIDDKTTIKIGSSDGEQAIAKYLSHTLDSLKASNDKAQDLQEKAGKADQLTSDLNQAKTKLAEEKTRADLAEKQLSEKPKEDALKQAKIDGYNRRLLEQTAEKFLPADIKINHDWSDRQIQEAVVLHQLGYKADSAEAKEYKDMADVDIAASYRIVSRRDSSAALRVAATDAKPEQKQDADMMARENYIKRLQARKKTQANAGVAV